MSQTVSLLLLVVLQGLICTGSLQCNVIFATWPARMKPLTDMADDDYEELPWC